jgi:hypothetical protein
MNDITMGALIELNNEAVYTVNYEDNMKGIKHIPCEAPTK